MSDKIPTAARKKLRDSVFAGPHRSFPITDRVHADKALQLVSRSEKAGHLTPEEAAHIRHVAHTYLAVHHAMNSGGDNEQNESY